MIDIENQVYAPIAEALREQFSGIRVSGEYVKAPSGFPYVSIVEQDNYQTETHLTTSEAEGYATLMYEVNVYSNKATGKKPQCREIISVIDQMLYGLNFKRISLSPIPNLEDATIYRLTARYRVETDGTNLYRR